MFALADAPSPFSSARARLRGGDRKSRIGSARDCESVRGGAGCRCAAYK